MEAYIYARWSSLEQSAGSTLERQIGNCERYIGEKGWRVSLPPIIDRGRSAYTGANLSAGNLGKFAERFRTGGMGPNIVLVVEELDRLSRQPADVMLTWLSPLVRAGLTIAVTNSGQIINSQMLDRDMGGLMMILITSFGSHAESQKKADRVGAAWESKRNKARAGEAVQRNHRRPHWVDVDPTTGEMIVTDENRRIIELIFQNRLVGIGKMLTAMNLNAAGVPTWGGGKIKQAMWTGTYVGRVLRNRAVMGEWQPHSKARADAAKRPAGEPIEDYYPQVIDPVTFAKANDARAKDAAKHQGRGRSLSNLLGTKARCGTCGGQMAARGSSSIHTLKPGRINRDYFLYCNSAKIGKTCTNQIGWRYDPIERTILDHILDLAMDDSAFVTQDHGPLEAAVYAARAAAEGIAARKMRLLKIMEVSDDDDLMDQFRARKLEERVALDAVEAAEAALSIALGQVSPAEHIKRVREVRELMMDEDEDVQFLARSKVKAALASVVEKIDFADHRQVMQRDGSLATVACKLVYVSLVDGSKTMTIDEKGQVLSDYDFSKPGSDKSYLSADDRASVAAIERRKETIG